MAFLFSCSRDTLDESLPLTRAALSVGLADNGEVEELEDIKTIRFIVFGDASGSPYLDTNVLDTRDVPVPATDIAVRNLEVKSNDDIMIIVIVNEPQELVTRLENVGSLSDLQNLEYDIADILNANEGIDLMPMTGVIRGISVLPGKERSVRMVIERTVARVDVFLQATSDGAETGYTDGSTSVTLHNLTYEGYFVMGNESNGTRDNASYPSRNFGQVKADVLESTLLEKTWTAGTTVVWAYSADNDAKNRRLLCSFYTAERIFRTNGSDKLTVSMKNVRKGPQNITGVTEQEIGQITTAGEDGQAVTKDFTEFRRNNVYQITAKVGKLGIQIAKVTVEEWGARTDIDLDLDL